MGPKPGLIARANIGASGEAFVFGETPGVCCFGVIWKPMWGSATSEYGGIGSIGSAFETLDVANPGNTRRAVDGT